MGKKADDLTELFATTSLGAPEKAVGFVLWRVVHRYMREVDRALEPLGLTHLQFTTLAMAAWMGRAEQDVSQSDLARFSDIHPMQVSQMLKILEGKKLVRRTRSTVDVRAKRIEITAAGLSALRRALPIAIQVQHGLFGEEGKTGGRLLTTLLKLESRQID